MPSTLRRRIFCHYCGQRSRFQLTPKEGRKFKCEHCEAVNFLDENGDIADVPPEETASPRQYARTTSPVRSQETSRNPVFCSTCLKNQALYTEALSQYFPESGDSSDSQYDARLPDYKKALEDRFPQCCANCEPRVRQQLQQATYAAKSDHVRRMLERTRQRRIASKWGWRSLVVRLGGVSYGLSLAAQLAWHAVGAFAIDGIFTNVERPSDRFWLCLTGQQTSQSCANILGHVVGPALVLALLSVWWNPKWQHKLTGSEGHLRGLQEYYQTQAVLLAVRFISWIVLNGAPDGRMLSLQRPLHCVSLVLESIISLWSMFSIIRIDTVPPVNWQQDPAPLLSSNQFVPPSRPETHLFPPPNSQSMSQPSQTFPIGGLASSTKPEEQMWRPPTPPNEDLDAMDLDYTPVPFQPVQAPIFVKSPQPTPFYGTLPAVPTNRLLHPRPEMQPSPKKAIGIPPGFFDRPSGSGGNPQEKNQGSIFADPTLFPRDAKIDTGLENIFGTVFSLREDPIEIPDVQMQDPPSAKVTIFDLKPQANAFHAKGPSPAWSTTNIIALLYTSGLFFSLSFLLIAEYLPYPLPAAKLAINVFGACVPATHVLLSLQNSNLRSSDNTLHLVEFIILSALAWCKSGLDLMSDMTHTKIIIPMLALMIYPEAYLVFQSDNGYTAADSETNLEKPSAQLDPVQTQGIALEQALLTKSTPWGPNGGNWSDQKTQGLSRPRTGSIDSEVSSASAVTSSTASGWKTPKASNARTFGQQHTPGYASGFSRLALDDVPVGRTVAGPRDRGLGGRRR